jgi:hypothetical protein
MVQFSTVGVATKPLNKQSYVIPELNLTENMAISWCGSVVMTKRHGMTGAKTVTITKQFE